MAALPEPRPATIETARETLRRVFGHAAFRGLQQQVIERVLAGGDAIAVLPTGGGKSVCYQIPALLRPGVGLVVSPLIALMADQVAALKAAGVRAGRLDSSLSGPERQQTLDAMAAGALDLVYVAPEGLASGWLAERLARVPVSLIAIDEAHCVSQWGHDFRPDYRRLAALRDWFPGVPRIAVTATADPRTRADIRAQLRLESAEEFVASFDRPNLVLNATRKDGSTPQRILRLIRDRPGQCGIVYATARKATEELAASLAREGVNALAYHAGLDPAERALRLERFQREDQIVMVATIAFGMGIDKPDVRYVIHADPPKCIEAYWQEVGRAGRDGLSAEGFCFYGASDRRLQGQRIEESGAPDPVRQTQRVKLNQLYAWFESLSCRRAGIRAYFGEEAPEPCGVCDTCRDPGAGHDATEAARMALSAVLRCEERLGKARLANHLTGTEPEGAMEHDFATRSTFGIGKTLPKAAWRRVYDQLLFEGILIDEPVDGFALVRVGDPDRARAILRGEARLMMREDPAHAGRTRARTRRSETAGSPDWDADAAAMARFQALKAWRLRVAVASRLPPYAVFSDATLRALAVQAPRDEVGLLAVPGVGEAKLKRYGRSVLELVAAA